MKFRVGDIIKYTHPPEKVHQSHRALSKQYGDRHYRVVAADPIHVYIESMNSEDTFHIFQWCDFKIVMLEEYLKYVDTTMRNWTETSKINGGASTLNFEDG